MPFDQEILQKAAGALRSTVQGTQQVGKSETKVNGGSVHSVSHGTQKSGPAEAYHHTKVQISRVFNITFLNISLCLWVRQIKGYFVQCLWLY